MSCSQTELRSCLPGERAAVKGFKSVFSLRPGATPISPWVCSACKHCHDSHASFIHHSFFKFLRPHCCVPIQSCPLSSSPLKILPPPLPHDPFRSVSSLPTSRDNGIIVRLHRHGDTMTSLRSQPNSAHPQSRLRRNGLQMWNQKQNNTHTHTHVEENNNIHWVEWRQGDSVNIHK